MISALTLKVLGAFAVFVLSIAGFALPQYLLKNFGESSSIESLVISSNGSSPFFTYGFYGLKAFASGVIFGVAMMHLLVDALESLEVYSKFPSMYLFIYYYMTCVSAIFFVLDQHLSRISINRHNCLIFIVAPCVIGLGVFLAIGMEQIAHQWIDSNKKRAAKKGIKLPTNSSSKGGAQVRSSSKGLELRNFGGGSGFDDADDGPEDSTHSVDNWLDTPTFTVPDSIETNHNVKLYVLEIAIAIHSVIIGFGFGATDTSRGTDIEVLMIAFCFHQFFEGVGLSVAVSHSSLDVSMVTKFGIFFAVTFPIGVILGLFVSVSEAQQLMQGIANALAAGILIQASLVEMISVDFNDERLKGFYLLKLLMFFCLVGGFVAMSALALLE